MITIEKAAEKDLETICTLDSMVLGNSSRRDFLANAVKADQCLVARTQNTVVGFGILERSFYGQGFISLLIVHPDYRKRGVATDLLRHIESICPTEKLFTSTNKANVIAQRVFETHGFVRSGYIENLDEGDHEIIYFKRLRGDGV
ncbi:GNAT family N-acetyltransferase [Dehalococcoidia bacterium]|nr:GNAT family N-acetyltransferase [Dehalococcoidia bacterium]MCL0058741.1 GNAT family N-acetyltransferase [Dehalococcoidia bacterium]MCL0090898.1 GNAT family N-acetyltransferase [Dehalococcoidia bacterium]